VGPRAHLGRIWVNEMLLEVLLVVELAKKKVNLKDHMARDPETQSMDGYDVKCGKLPRI
jgi:hypothetical protein